MKSFDWKYRGEKYYYFEEDTGKIVGLVSKHALSDVWFALAYVGNESFTITDELHLGQYIDSDHAKDALVKYWFTQSMTLIEDGRKVF